MALDKLKYTYQDPAKVSELNVDDVLNVTNTINTTTVNSKAQIISPVGSNVALTLKGASNATYDLQQFKNSSGTTTSGVNSAGQLYVGGSTTSTSAFGALTAGLSNVVTADGTTVTYYVSSGYGQQPFFAGATVTITGFTVVTGYNGTFVIQSVGGTPGNYFFTVANTATGTPGASAPSAYQSPNLFVSGQNPWNVPAVIRGTGSQTANLTEWQNSSGGVIAQVASNGNIVTSSTLQAQTITLNGNMNSPSADGMYMSTLGNSSNTLNSGSLDIRTSGINQLPLKIRQTATISGVAITSASANGTTSVTYTASFAKYVVAGMSFTITGVVSTGNPSATAGSGFNLTNATVSSATSTTFTLTAPTALTDTYTSGGVATWQGGSYPDMTQWVNSSGTTVAKINYAGFATFNAGISTSQSVAALYLIDTASTGSTVSFPVNTANTVNTSYFKIQSRFANQLPLLIKGTSGVVAPITSASANGTTVTYNLLYNGFYLYVGQTITITGILSNNNPGGTAGVGFNLTNATIASVNSNTITVTNALSASETYTSGGTLSANQSGDLTQWQDGNGNLVAYINSAGAFTSNQTIGTSGYLYSVSPASFGSNGLNNTYQVQVINGTTARIGLMVKGAASQTADLQQWQNSSGTVLASVDAYGTLLSNWKAYIQSGATYLVPMTIRGAASQTANLQEWQDSTGAVLSKIDYRGWLILPASNRFVLGGGIGDFAETGSYLLTGSSNITIGTRSASNKGLIIQGAASQTANLQEWQDSSGTVLSSITKNGLFSTPGILENPTISATAATGTINYDLLTNKSITYYTSNSSANWTLNIRGDSSTTLDSLMAIGQSLTIIFMAAQGTTAYYQSGLQIDGTSVTPKWQGGLAPTFGNVSGIDAYSITIMKTASATFTVFESQTRFA